MTLSAASVLATLNAAEGSTPDVLGRLAQPMMRGVANITADKTNWNIVAGVRSWSRVSSWSRFWRGRSGSGRVASAMNAISGDRGQHSAKRPNPARS